MHGSVETPTNMDSLFLVSGLEKMQRLHVHFLGPVKPWQHQYLSTEDTVILSPGTYSSQIAAQDFIRRWWQDEVYCSAEQVCASRLSQTPSYIPFVKP